MQTSLKRKNFPEKPGAFVIKVNEFEQETLVCVLVPSFTEEPISPSITKNRLICANQMECLGKTEIWTDLQSSCLEKFCVFYTAARILYQSLNEEKERKKKKSMFWMETEQGPSWQVKQSYKGNIILPPTGRVMNWYTHGSFLKWYCIQLQLKFLFFLVAGILW